MKIFNLSLHRSATQSFSQFLQENGYRATHWPGREFDKSCRDLLDIMDTKQIWTRLLSVIDVHDVFSDVPYCFTFREAYEAFPDSKFVILLRDPTKWLQSVRSHIHNREMDNLEKIQYWLFSPKRFSHIIDYSDQDISRVYLRHLQSVLNFMTYHRAELRVFLLDSLELGEEIGQFVGFTPKTRFPHRDWPGKPAYERLRNLAAEITQ